MRIQLEENKGVPASLLWTLAIIAGVSVANLYYNQPLLNRISEDLHVSEFTANLIPMVTQIGYAAGLLFIIPLGDLYKRRNIIVICFLLLSVSLFGIALYSDSCPVFPSRAEGAKRGFAHQRTIDGDFRLACRKWHRRRILGLAHHFLYRFRLDVSMYFRDTSFASGYAFQLSGHLSRPDEIRLYPCAPERDSSVSVFPCRTLLRMLPYLVGLPCLQDERCAFLCGKQHHRDVGLMRDSRSLDRFFCREIRPPLRSKEFQLHRMRHHDTGMVCPLFLSKQLCRHRCRNHFDRHRHAMHPNKQSDLCLVFRTSCFEPGEHHFYDYLLHRRSFRDIPCRHGLASCRMGRSGFSRHCSCRHFFAYYAFR